MLEQSKRSLAFSTLFQMGLRITFVIIATAALSYLHIINNLEEQTLDKLKKYITERASKDSTIFQLAQDNHALLKRDFLSLWEKRKMPMPKRVLNASLQHPKMAPIALMLDITQVLTAPSPPRVLIGDRSKILLALLVVEHLSTTTLFKTDSCWH